MNVPGIFGFTSIFFQFLQSPHAFLYTNKPEALRQQCQYQSAYLYIVCCHPTFQGSSKYRLKPKKEHMQELVFSLYQYLQIKTTFFPHSHDW